MPYLKRVKILAPVIEWTMPDLTMERRVERRFERRLERPVEQFWPGLLKIHLPAKFLRKSMIEKNRVQRRVR